MQELSDGSGNLNIVDPYGLMLVTNNDIEKALADATNHKSFDVAIGISESTYAFTLNALNDLRDSRNVYPISIRLNPDSVFGKKVQVVIDGLGYDVVFSYDGIGGTGINRNKNGKIEVLNSTSSVTFSESAKFGSPDLGINGINDKEEQLLRTLIVQAYHYFDIKNNILTQVVYTPNEWQKMFNLYKGSGLGLAHGLNQIGALRPANKDEKLNNVYYVGASTHPGTGLPIVVIGSRLVTERIENEH